MLFFTHASSREKHPESSSLVFKTSFCCDSTASMPAQHQDYFRILSLLLCSPPPVSHFGRSFPGQASLLFPGAIPHHKAWFCSSLTENLPQELPQLHPSLVQYLPLLIHFFWKDHRRDIQAPHWSHSLPRLVELGQSMQWSGLAPSPWGLQGRKGARFVHGISWNPFKSLRHFISSAKHLRHCTFIYCDVPS